MRWTAVFAVAALAVFVLTGCPGGTTGGIYVNILPAEAVTAGAQWQVDGGAYQVNQALVLNLAAGDHTVSFKTISGWGTPANQVVTLAAGQVAMLTGTYTLPGVSGSLTVTITPTAAVTAGAQWQVDGGAYQNSGATVSGLSAGAHTVAFKTVSGWTTPASQSTSIVANQTTSLTGAYVQQVTTGSLRVNLFPAGAISAGGTWRVDAGDYHGSGFTLTNLPPGKHRVSYNVIPGYTMPLSQEVTITTGQLSTLSGSYSKYLTSSTYVVLGYNELGMHCMNQDFSEFMILPPYNVLRATVIQRGEEPVIVKSGVTLRYSFRSNTTSAGKTNFWDYEDKLFGVNLAPNIGLTGNGMSGSMSFVPSENRNDWVVTGIPITPLDDDGSENPYPECLITVAKGGTDQVQTQAVVPVSWEISCNLCHNTPGISPATDILRRHDQMHGTTLEAQKPVACGGCHAQPELGFAGDGIRHSLSRAMHGAHASRMSMVQLDVSCYACHPGMRTQCLRDIHYSKGIVCTNCHGDMQSVADPSRMPWATEPRCDDCHTRAGFQFEQPNTLYRNSKGHNGVQCAACHNSPHAITPTVKAEDNVQAIAYQGHAGVINTCTVCHTQTPDDPFNHTVSDKKSGSSS